MRDETGARCQTLRANLRSGSQVSVPRLKLARSVSLANGLPPTSRRKNGKIYRSTDCKTVKFIYSYNTRENEKREGLVISAPNRDAAFS